MKTRFILGSALAAVLLMWVEQVRLWPRRILIKWRRNWKNG